MQQIVSSIAFERQERPNIILILIIKKSTLIRYIYPNISEYRAERGNGGTMAGEKADGDIPISPKPGNYCTMQRSVTMQKILTLSCVAISLGLIHSTGASAQSDDFFSDDDRAICAAVQEEGYTLEPEGIAPAMLEFYTQALEYEYGEYVNLAADPELVRRMELYLLTGTDCIKESVSFDVSEYYDFDEAILEEPLSEPEIASLRERYAMPLDDDTGLPLDADTGLPTEPPPPVLYSEEMMDEDPTEPPLEDPTEPPPEDPTEPLLEESPEPASEESIDIIFIGPETECVSLDDVTTEYELLWRRFFLTDCDPMTGYIAPAPSLQVLIDYERCPGNKKYMVWFEECTRKTRNPEELASLELARMRRQKRRLQGLRDAASQQGRSSLGAFMLKPMVCGTASVVLFVATAPASGTVILVMGGVAVASSAANLNALQGWAVGHTAEALMTGAKLSKVNPAGVALAVGDMVWDWLGKEARERALQDFGMAKQMESIYNGKLTMHKLKEAKLRAAGGDEKTQALTDGESCMDCWSYSP